MEASRRNAGRAYTKRARWCIMHHWSSRAGGWGSGDRLKKLLIIVVALLILGALLVAVPLSGQFAGIQYEKRVQMDLLIAAGEAEWLQAEHGGVTTQVVGGNLSRISRVLTPKEAKHLLFPPKLEPEITLTFSNGDVICLSADPDAQDRAIVLLKQNNKTAAFAIEGYQVMKNVADAVSPEGFSEENPLA